MSNLRPTKIYAEESTYNFHREVKYTEWSVGNSAFLSFLADSWEEFCSLFE